MKFLALFLAMVLLAVSVFAAPADDPLTLARRCVEGKRYHDGCNQCWCTPSGRTACTMMACMTRLPDGKFAAVKRIEPPADYWRQA